MTRKVILDVDPGIDDAMALCIALSNPALDVVAVTAVACWWLVPRAGLKGAALALCLMAASQLCSRGLVIACAMRAAAGASPARKAPQS